MAVGDMPTPKCQPPNANMILIVGLGNPGKEYQKNRHNLGFMVLDAFRARHSLPEWKNERKIFGLTSRGRIQGEEVILLKPQTFMNDSGRAVTAALSFYHLKVSDLWLIHDEAAFPLGIARLSPGGGSGGHNGVQSIIDAVGERKFVRFRLGIGEQRAGREPLKSLVLKNFKKSEAAALSKIIKSTEEALDKALGEGLAKAMQAVNTGD